MRRTMIGTGLVLAGLSFAGLGAGVARAAVHHHTVAHHTSYATHASCAPANLNGEAFNVTGLKSELMVTALACNEQDRYNAFVAKFHPELIDEEAALNSYFDHNFGRGAQRAHDDYITQLANVQADNGVKSGVAFCEQRRSMFDEVSVLNSATDLAGYARGKDIVQPVGFMSCEAPSSGGSGVRVRRVGSHTHHH